MRWTRFFRRKQRDAECERDIRFHIETEAAENVARGMPAAEAEAAARRKFGNTGLIREEVYGMHTAIFLETIWRDLLYAARALRQNPGFAATAILTLALGIGGNTAIFTVIRPVLLKPLPFRDPDRLVYLSVDYPRRNLHFERFGLNALQRMRAAQRCFTGIGAHGANPENMSLAIPGAEPEALKGARVSADFLEILGVRPAIGRSFVPAEDVRGGPAVALISTALWKRRFAGDPHITGALARLDDIPYTIAGVLPEGFEFPFAGVDVWVTRPSEWSFLPPRFWNASLLFGFARLKDGVSLERARAEMDALHRRISTDSDSLMRVVPLKDQLVAGFDRMLWMLLGAVGFVLLIACASVASLLLARAASRSHELAVRAALGAGRSRLIGQVLAESLVLSIAGGTLGLLVARWGLHAILSLNALQRPALNALYVPGGGAIHLDPTVLAFTLALSAATGVLFGLFPSLQVSRPDLADVLRERGAARSGGWSGRRGVLGINLRGLLVTGQIALSVVLLIGAVLLVKSVARLRGVDPGFRVSNLLTMKVSLPTNRYDTPEKKMAFFGEVASHIATMPEVKDAAVAMSLPTTNNYLGTNVEVVGMPSEDAAGNPAIAQLQSVTPGYFRTLGIPLRRGREFTARDNVTGARPVVMINESFARRFWPEYPRGVDPLGRQMFEGADKLSGLEIVGIVADVRERGLATDAPLEFYLPVALHPPQGAFLAVRTQGDPLRLADAVRRQVRRVDDGQAVSDVRTMDGILDAAIGQRRLTMLLLGMFAGVALLLAVVGIYGVTAYSVTQRTQEVGIRRALGAQQGDILRLVLGQGLTLAAIGVILGIGAAFALTRVMREFLFEVSATDPVIFVGIGLLFIAVASAASLIPARRAVRVDPMAALRVG